jgi:hypothetical protein
MNAFNDAWNLLKLSPNEFNIDSDEGNKRVSYNNQMRDNRSAESYARGGETDEDFRARNPLPEKDILQEALDMARRRPPQKPLEIENLPPQTVQTKLPEELTAGATVADKDFRDVKWPRMK